MNEDILARETCERFLTAAQLKDICKYRGFGAPPGSKDQLAAYVAARFNGAEGVPGAMRSLDETCLTILHFMAMSENQPTVADLDGLLHPGRQHYGNDSRGDFNLIAGGLLNRGVVLIHDTLVTRYSGESRYPDSHWQFLRHTGRSFPRFPLRSSHWVRTAPARTRWHFSDRPSRSPFTGPLARRERNPMRCCSASQRFFLSRKASLRSAGRSLLEWTLFSVRRDICGHTPRPRNKKGWIRRRRALRYTSCPTSQNNTDARSRRSDGASSDSG